MHMGRELTKKDDRAIARQAMVHDVPAAFAVLADRWHDETAGISATHEITGHPAYLEIINGLGAAAVPCILRDLESRGGQWFTALRLITNENPVPAEARGNPAKMKHAWLQWGRDQGLIT
jgi:hypothetical protein